MSRLVPVLAVVAALVAAGGCTGSGSGESTATPSPRSPSPTMEYGQNDVSDLCTAISRSTLLRLKIRENASGSLGSCFWQEKVVAGDSQATSRLTVGHEVHGLDDPDEATDDAEKAFDREREGQQFTSVRGLGDEARVYPYLSLHSGDKSVGLRVREANVVIEVAVTQESYVERDADPAIGFDGVESATLTATREVLGKLTGSRVPVPKRSAYQRGELARVRPVCRSVDAPKRMLPGARSSDVSAKKAKLGRGCVWRYDESVYPSLEVHVQAVAPSRTAGGSATSAAKALHGPVRFYEKRRGVGDEALIDHGSYRGGHRVATLLVRRGNLLVSVDYGRDDHPSKKRMERDVVRVAKQVLAANG